MTTKLFVLFYASALAVAIAGEAPSVSGSVKDPQGRPVAGAAVGLFSRSSSAVAATTSNSQGAYRFEEVTPGDYLLRAEAPGFAVFLEDRVRVDSALTRDIALELAGVREQVVVTASGTSQAPDEVSKSVTVIDRAEAQQRDAFALSDVVTLAAGVRVQQLGGPGQVTSIRLRGMRDIDTAVVVDGLRLRDAAVLHGDAYRTDRRSVVRQRQPRRGTERRGIVALRHQRYRRRREYPDRRRRREDARQRAGRGRIARQHARAGAGGRRSAGGPPAI